MNNKLKSHVALLSANSIWGLMVPISKDLLNSNLISAMTLSISRIIIAAILFWIISLFLPISLRKQEKIAPDDKWKFLIASLFVISANQVLIIQGMALTSPVDCAVICSTTPIFCILISLIFYKVKFSFFSYLGVVMGFVGMMFLVLGGEAQNELNVVNPLLGNVLCMLAQLCGAIYLVSFSSMINRYSPFFLMKWLFTISAIVLLPFSVFQFIEVPWTQLTPNMWLEFGYIVLFATFIAYLLLPVGQKYVQSTIVAMYNYLQPVVGILFSILVGLAVVDCKIAVATLLIFSGVYIVNKYSK